MEREYTKEFIINFKTDRGGGSHIHQDVELLYVIEGEFQVQIFDKIFELKNEEFLMINSNYRHSWIAEGEQPSVICEIHFDYGMVREHLDNKMIFFYCNSTKEDDSRYEYVRGLLSQLLSECAVNEDKTTFRKISLVYGLLDYLVQYFMAGETTGIFSKADLRVEKMLQYLNNHYESSPSLQEMADLMYMAPASFSRFFKKTIGINFLEYVNQLRLHFALEDLRYTNHSITWISEKHGFTNVSAFCRNFKEEYGESPLSYRKNLEQKEQVQKSGDKEIRRSLRKYIEKDQAKTSAGGKMDMVHIECDARQFAVWNNPWNQMMNLGFAYELLDGERQRQVIQAKKDLGFQIGRIYGIFSEKMMFRQGHGEHIINYTFFDRVLDFLTAAGIRPLISLDNKTKSILKDVNNVLYKGPEDILFESQEEFLSVLDDFLDHIIGRYSRKAVSQWFFECWYYTYNDTVMGLSLDYIELFAKIKTKIRKKLPDAAVGGWGISTTESDDRFRFSKTMEAWGKSEVHPDFISLYLFPYVDRESPVRGSRRLLNTAEYYKRAVANCRMKMDECGFNHVPIYVVGWNTSISDRNFFNETCGKAALMLQMMAELNDRIEYAGYMELSDLGSVFCDTGDLVYGGKGLMNVCGIKKPAYYALMFMNQMKPYLIYRDSYSVIATDDRDSYTILCFNAKRLKYNYYRKDEDAVQVNETNIIFEDEKNLEIVFCLNDVTNGEYQIREYSMGPEHGNFLDEWIRLGQIGQLEMSDCQYLKEISQPSRRQRSVTVRQGKLILLQMLHSQEFCLLEISRW